MPLFKLTFQLKITIVYILHALTNLYDYFVPKNYSLKFALRNTNIFLNMYIMDFAKFILPMSKQYHPNNIISNPAYPPPGAGLARPGNVI